MKTVIALALLALFSTVLTPFSAAAEICSSTHSVPASAGTPPSSILAEVSSSAGTSLYGNAETSPALASQPLGHTWKLVVRILGRTYSWTSSHLEDLYELLNLLEELYGWLLENLEILTLS